MNATTILAVSGLQLAIDITSGSLALASAIIATAAARHGLPSWRPYHAAVAVLSLLYLAGYIWLIGFAPTVSIWSGRMRGVGLVAWPVVWMVPSILSMRSFVKLHRLDKLVKSYDDLLTEDDLTVSPYTSPDHSDPTTPSEPPSHP